MQRLTYYWGYDRKGCSEIGNRNEITQRTLENRSGLLDAVGANRRGRFQNDLDHWGQCGILELDYSLIS